MRAVDPGDSGTCLLISRVATRVPAWSGTTPLVRMQAMRKGTEPASSFRAIENLMAAYAELVDRGDFAGVGTLLSAATFTGGGPSVRGAAAIETMGLRTYSRNS